MNRLTNPAQGYCEMYCKKYGHCFDDPGDCIFQEDDAPKCADAVRKAATALSALQAENEKLRAELKQKVKLAQQQANELGRRDKLLKEQEAELERMKKIMRDNGILVIPSKYPGGRSEWNIPKPRGPKED